jgi:hypothetical protein
MKILPEHRINYIVHAISILDLNLLEQILKPLAHSVVDKCEVGQYLFDFERIFRELDFNDTHFKVAHRLCTNEGCKKLIYTFIANCRGNNFIINFEENQDGMILINECKEQSIENQIRFSSFKGNDIEVPF